jgi:hypothetical protein
LIPFGGSGLNKEGQRPAHLQNLLNLIWLKTNLRLLGGLLDK